MARKRFGVKKKFYTNKQKYTRKNKSSIERWVKAFRKSNRNNNYSFKGRGKYWKENGLWHCYLYWKD